MAVSRGFRGLRLAMLLVLILTGMADLVRLFAQSEAAGPDGGSVYSIAVTATHPVTTVFASLQNGGVFKSVDGGSTWAPSDRGLPEQSLCGLSADPNSTSVLYAACLDDIFKTVDAGQSWFRLDVDAYRPPLPLVAPSDSRIVYHWTTTDYMFKSRNGGMHWEMVTVSGLPDDRSAQVVVDPSNPSLLYAGSSGGVYKSTDGGEHFVRISRDLPEVSELAVDPGRPGTLYAGTTFDGIFRTTDGGAVWAAVNNGLPEESVRRIELGGSRGEALYAQVGSKIFRSVDEGDHWTLIRGEQGEQIVWTLAADPLSPTTLYVGTSSGVYVTRDAGAQWTTANRGVPRMTVTSVVVHESGTSTVLAYGDAGLFSSLDRGDSWRPLAPSPTLDRLVSLEPDGSGGVIARTRSGYLLRARGQTSWSPVRTRDPGGDIRSLWLAPGRATVMYAATDDALLMTTDGAERWTARSLPGGRVPAHMAVAHGNPAIAYAMTADLLGPTHLWRTTDGGRTWAEVDLCSERSRVGGACMPVFDPNDVNTLYVMVDDGSIVGGGAILRTSRDGGETWQQVNGPVLMNFTVVPTRPATLFADTFDPAAYGRRILLKSVDGGEHWIPSGTGLPERHPVTRIVFDPANLDHLFVGTIGRGVFRSIDGGTTWVPTGTPLRTRTRPE